LCSEELPESVCPQIHAAQSSVNETELVLSKEPPCPVLLLLPLVMTLAEEAEEAKEGMVTALVAATGMDLGCGSGLGLIPVLRFFPHRNRELIALARLIGMRMPRLGRGCSQVGRISGSP
jgi:hypothetical protein